MHEFRGIYKKSPLPRRIGNVVLLQFKNSTLELKRDISRFFLISAATFYPGVKQLPSSEGYRF